MRTISFNPQPRKKLRGLRRKCLSMISEIRELTAVFPTADCCFWNPERNHWHIHLPVAEVFIDSCRTPTSVRRLCAQTLIDQAHHLATLAPRSTVPVHVLATVTLPKMFDSVIAVYTECSNIDFYFSMESADYSVKRMVDTGRSLSQRWALHIPDGMSEQGCVYHKEDGQWMEDGERWVYYETINPSS